MLKLVGLVVLLAMGSGFSAWADGKVFTTAIAEPVTTPDQRAMLQFSNGVERLVIETSFVGKGEKFAWVVPLPSAPKVEAVSTNFFRQLNLSFQPYLIREADPWWILFLWLGYIIGTSIWVFRHGGGKRLERWLKFNFLVHFLGVLILPMFATASLGANKNISTSSVQVLDRQSVGIYNTTTIAGTNGTALLAWMNANGFQTPATALPAISNYAAHGWVFVAATINRNVFAANGSRPHPLGFTFNSAQPVYPLQLTGVENPHCSIELFVFGPDRAEAPGFRAEYCGQPSVIDGTDIIDTWAQRELFGMTRPGDFKFGGPEILRWGFPAGVVTKLVGELGSRQMKTDAGINWVSFQPAVPTYHAPKAARGKIFNWLTGVCVPGLILFQISFAGTRKKLWLPGLVALIFVAAVCCAVRAATIKTVKVTYIRGGKIHAVNNFRYLDRVIGMLLDDYQKPTNTVRLTETNILSEILNYAEDSKGNIWLKNAFTDKDITFEPTPGNLTARTSTNGLEVFWHDYYGGPHKLATFLPK